MRRGLVLSHFDGTNKIAKSELFICDSISKNVRTDVNVSSRNSFVFGWASQGLHFIFVMAYCRRYISQAIVMIMGSGISQRNFSILLDFPVHPHHNDSVFMEA